MEGDYIPDLKKKLFTEKELEIIICRLVKAIHDAVERGNILESAQSVEEVARIRAEADSTEAFLTECAVIKKDGRVRRTDLLAAYEDFCKQEDRQALSKTSFYKSMRTKGYLEVKDDGHICFKGVELGFMKTPEDEEPAFD